MIEINGRAVLLGIFDGLHLGHMRAVRELMKYPGEKIVYTFNSATVTTKGSRRLLITDGEKREMLAELGADRVVSEDFAEVRELSAFGFLDMTVKRRLGCDTVIAGENFRFGAGALAGERELRGMCETLGLTAITVPTLFDGGEPVSTTRIRGLIERGEIAEANRLLGRRYGFCGRFSKELRLDRMFSRRALSLEIDPERVIPKRGIYASRLGISGREYLGVTEIFDIPGKSRAAARTVLTAKPEGAAGECGKLMLEAFIRPGRAFDTEEELKETLRQDLENAEKISVSDL